MTSIIKPLSTALFGSLLLSGCVLDEDNDDYSVGVQVSDAEKGVAEVTVTVTGDFAEGQSINVTPHMQMVDGPDGTPGMEHGTPFSVNEGELDSSGQFKTTAYFLMPSNMPAAMGGEKMGDWSINVEYNDVTENFPITVEMMPDDKKTVSENGRSYYLFDLGLKAMNGMDQFSVYISSRETMFEYSPVSEGVTLNTGDANLELSLENVVVDMCTAADCTADSITEDDWTLATADDSVAGKYTAMNLGLAGDGSDTVQIRLTINNATTPMVSDAFSFASMPDM